MVGIRSFPFWNGVFSGAMLILGGDFVVWRYVANVGKYSIHGAYGNGYLSLPQQISILSLKMLSLSLGETRVSAGLAGGSPANRSK